MPAFRTVYLHYVGKSPLREICKIVYSEYVFQFLIFFNIFFTDYVYNYFTLNKEIKKKLAFNKKVMPPFRTLYLHYVRKSPLRGLWKIIYFQYFFQFLIFFIYFFTDNVINCFI